MLHAIFSGGITPGEFFHGRKLSSWEVQCRHSANLYQVFPIIASPWRSSAPMTFGGCRSSYVAMSHEISENPANFKTCHSIHSLILRDHPEVTQQCGKSQMMPHLLANLCMLHLDLFACCCAISQQRGDIDSCLAQCGVELLGRRRNRQCLASISPHISVDCQPAETN